VTTALPVGRSSPMAEAACLWAGTSSQGSCVSGSSVSTSLASSTPGASAFATSTPLPTQGPLVYPPSTPIRSPGFYQGATFTPTSAPTATLTSSQQTDLAHANACTGPAVGSDTSRGNGTDGAGGLRPENPPNDKDHRRVTPDFQAPSDGATGRIGLASQFFCTLPPSAVMKGIHFISSHL
jgi:hypothetical protein